jgi:hypothetical protein
MLRSLFDHMITRLERRWSYDANHVRAGNLSVVAAIRAARINGLPGAVVSLPDGAQTIAFEPDAAGAIAAIYIVRNPDKLARL